MARQKFVLFFSVVQSIKLTLMMMKMKKMTEPLPTPNATVQMNVSECGHRYEEETTKFV